MRRVTVELNIKPGETPLDYHKRIIYGKLVDKSLSDIDYTELAELVYGQSYSSDVARRMMYGSRKTLDLIADQKIQSISDSKVLSDIDMKLAELKIERQKFYDQRNAYNKILRERSRQEELNDIISQAIGEGSLPKLEQPRTDCIHKSGNDLIVTLHDIHYGANIDNAWYTYNSDICRDMMNTYLEKIIDISNTHECENCIVVCAGDCISGNIHYSIAVTNKENVIQQVVGVSELIADFVYSLSGYFKNVRYISVAGNHSRISQNKNESLTEERLDNLIEWYLKARLQNVNNVTITDDHKYDATMSLFDVRGKTYCCVHGDFDATASSVQSLQTMAKRPLYAVLSGHLHHNKSDEVQGIKTLMAGSFLGMDDYCAQKRIYGRPEQMVCVCDETGIVCQYDVPLDINRK